MDQLSSKIPNKSGEHHGEMIAFHNLPLFSRDGQMFLANPMSNIEVLLKSLHSCVSGKKKTVVMLHVELNKINVLRRKVKWVFKEKGDKRMCEMQLN